MSNERSNNIISPTGKEAGLFYSITIISLLFTSLVFSLLINALSGGSAVAQTDWYKFLSFTIGGVPLLVAILVGMKITKLPLELNLKSGNYHPLFIIAAALIAFGMLFGLSETNNIIIELFKKIGYKPSETLLPKLSWWGLTILIIGVCVIPAIFEEIVFRHFILKGLSSIGSVSAVFFSALCFSLYHLSPEKTLYQFIVGILFAIIALKTKSILPSAAIHFVNNLFVILNYYFFHLSFQGNAKIIVTIVALIALFGGVLIFLMDGIRKITKESFKEFFVSLPKKFVEFFTKSREFFFYALAGIVVAIIAWVSAFLSW